MSAGVDYVEIVEDDDVIQKKSTPIKRKKKEDLYLSDSFNVSPPGSAISRVASTLR